ncbi:MAG: hypothetical protein ABW167_07840 [Baekduia sp.]
MDDPRVKEIETELLAALEGWGDHGVVGAIPQEDYVSARGRRKMVEGLTPGGFSVMAEPPPLPYTVGQRVFHNGVEHEIYEVSVGWSADGQAMEITYKVQPVHMVVCNARLAGLRIGDEMLLPDWVPPLARWSTA